MTIRKFMSVLQKHIYPFVALALTNNK